MTQPLPPTASAPDAPLVYPLPSDTLTAQLAPRRSPLPVVLAVLALLIGLIGAALGALALLTSPGMVSGQATQIALLQAEATAAAEQVAAARTDAAIVLQGLSGLVAELTAAPTQLLPTLAVPTLEPSPSTVIGVGGLNMSATQTAIANAALAAETTPETTPDTTPEVTQNVIIETGSVPTATATPSPTVTPPPTATATVTPTATITPTPTAVSACPPGTVEFELPDDLGQGINLRSQPNTSGAATTSINEQIALSITFPLCIDNMVIPDGGGTPWFSFIRRNNENLFETLGLDPTVEQLYLSSSVVLNEYNRLNSAGELLPIGGPTFTPTPNSNPASGN